MASKAKKSVDPANPTDLLIHALHESPDKPFRVLTSLEVEAKDAAATAILAGDIEGLEQASAKLEAVDRARVILQKLGGPAELANYRKRIEAQKAKAKAGSKTSGKSEAADKPPTGGGGK